MNLLSKLKENSVSVLPVMAVVLILDFTAAPLGAAMTGRFVIGGILVIIGLSLFLLGADAGILPVGEKAGAALTAKKNLPLLLTAAFFIGVLITIAEPDVQVLAQQIAGVNPSINPSKLIFMIAAGVGLFVSLGLTRTILQIPLKWILLAVYVLVFICAYKTPPEFLAVAFDSGGATTGPMTVPFIMALGVGVAAVRGGKNKSENDSFGLTGIASIGPILAVLLFGIFTDSSSADAGLQTAAASAGNSIFADLLPEIFHEVIMAMLPLIILFAVFQIFLIKMPPRQVIRMAVGLLWSFAGLTLFLLGVKYGFIPAGEQLGTMLASLDNSWLLIPIGILFGAIVVCAEPAVWVLTDQVEHISGGTIKRKLLLFSLSAGVAVSIGLSMWRVMNGFSLWYFMLPGYALALLLMFFCPSLFTAIAFDSGGVASGPMTSTFILSFTLGASAVSGGNPVTDAFGVIALVAMTPLITIQILGILFAYKKKKENYR
ncbi:MAG: DUF1538 domain-containing protein [Bacteroides sp.]|nr:DUF1538 domain-containing protein [Prevotella sp.]MCM1408830.1 DUF1538 domain-containing protein [Treponema brennaborense]MCM1470610.1 DUF1538 domain-containing protein [Bacteroides sp.]